MVSDNDELKLVDFGLSKKNSHDQKMHQKVGTPYYIAPEIINNKPYDSKVDMWSVGVMLYVLMSGYMPFEADTRD